MKIKKNIILFFSLIGSGFFALVAFTPLLRASLHIEYISSFSLIILFFSLITYKLPSRVFISWWIYARVAIPVVLISLMFIATNLIQSSLSRAAGWLPSLDELVLMIQTLLLFILFIIGSIVQIYRGYKARSGGLPKLFSLLALLGLVIVLSVYYTFLR